MNPIRLTRHQFKKLESIYNQMVAANKTVVILKISGKKVRVEIDYLQFVVDYYKIRYTK